MGGRYFYQPPPKPAFPLLQGQKSVVLGATFPVGSPALAPPDLALLSDGSAKGAASSTHARLSDPLLAGWQENMRRALEHISVVEALLLTVSRSVFGDAAVQPDSPTRPTHPRSRLCCATLVQAYECSREPRFRAHQHCVGASGRIAVAAYKQSTPVAMQAMLRMLPLLSESLFGPQLAEFLRTAQQV